MPDHAHTNARRSAAPPAGAVPNGEMLALNMSAPPADLPRKVAQCRAARHAICEELFSALNGETIPWAGSWADGPQGLGAVSAAVAAAAADPVEHYKCCWLHAAGRAADEGFRFDAAPSGYRGQEPCAHIRCAHPACRDHARDAVSIIVGDNIALKGLKMSGMVPKLNSVERCAHQRRLALSAHLPEITGEDRFVVPAGFRSRPGLTVRAVEDGMGVSVECKHSECATAGTQQVGVSWDPVMATLAAGG